MRNWLVMTAIGFGLAWFLDPVSGRRRRAVTRDKMVSYNHRFMDWIGGKHEDLNNRTRGLLTEARSFAEQNIPAMHNARI